MNSQEYIEVAIKIAPFSEENAEIVTAEISELPFESFSFLRIISVMSFQYFLYGYLPVFTHLSSHAKKVRCHSIPFWGLSTQWFSSGKSSSCAGTPRSLAALKAAID